MARRKINLTKANNERIKNFEKDTQGRFFLLVSKRKEREKTWCAPHSSNLVIAPMPAYVSLVQARRNAMIDDHQIFDHPIFDHQHLFTTLEEKKTRGGKKQGYTLTNTKSFFFVWIDNLK